MFMRNLLLTTVAAIAVASGANAATITEALDFADVRQIGGTALATLDVGSNNINGALGGTCVTGPGGGIDCNTAFGAGEDNQDSFILTVAPETTVSSISYNLAGSGPLFQTIRLQITDVADNSNSFTGSDFNPSSGFLGLALIDLNPGSYFFDVFGGNAFAAGSYTSNWSLGINVASTAVTDPTPPPVSEVPLPASSFLLMGGMAGLGMMRRKVKTA